MAAEADMKDVRVVTITARAGNAAAVEAQRESGTEGVRTGSAVIAASENAIARPTKHLSIRARAR